MELNHEKAVSVVVVCGLPGAGKSEICRNLTKDPGCEWIEYDAIEAEMLMQLHSQQDQDQSTHLKTAEDEACSLELEAWRWTRMRSLEKIEAILQRHEADESDASELVRVVVDDNFHLRSMRKRVHQLCLRYSSLYPIYFGVIWVDTSLPTCYDRNRNRAAAVNELVIQKLALSAEPPLLREERPKRNRNLGPFLWESACIRVSGETVAFSDSLAKIREFVVTLSASVDRIRDDRPEHESRLASDRLITQKSSRHSLDLMLRRCVKAVAQHHPALGRYANQVRQSVLAKSRDTSPASLVVDGSSRHGYEVFADEFCSLPAVLEWKYSERLQLQTLIRDAAIGGS
jgi:predicted kinase